jgi:hypothetical protein
MRQALFVFAVISTAAAPQDSFSPDKDGFVRHWLVLAPIPVEEGAGSSEIDKEQVTGEGDLKPKAGDKTKASGKELAWKVHQAKESHIDFLESFGADRGEDVAAYAVAYLCSDAEMKGLKLAIGSNDQCKVWFNGKVVVKVDETRTLEADQNTVDVTLNKGCNVLVMKVINEKNNWQACARLLKDGKPVTGYKVCAAPPR